MESNLSQKHMVTYVLPILFFAYTYTSLIHSTPMEPRVQH